MRFLIIEERFLASSVPSLAGVVSDRISVSSTSSWIATDSLEGESIICNFTQNDTLPKNMIVTSYMSFCSLFAVVIKLFYRNFVVSRPVFWFLSTFSLSNPTTPVCPYSSLSSYSKPNFCVFIILFLLLFLLKSLSYFSVSTIVGSCALYALKNQRRTFNSRDQV